MAVALAVAAALVYGVADFFGGLASRRSAALAVALWSQTSGLALLAVVLPLFPGHADAADLRWGVAAGFTGAAAIGLFYRALALGTMGIVSPTTAGLAAAIPALFAIARGERPSALAAVGIVAVVAAIVLVSVSPAPPGAPAPLRRGRLPGGMVEAIFAGSAFGLLFIALAQTHPAAQLVPLLAMRVTSIAALGIAGIAAGVPRLRLAHGGLRTVVVAGLLDMGANVLYLLAAHAGMLAIVAVLTSLYPAATVALAAGVLRERLSRLQWSGVTIALLGVALLASAR